MFEVWQICKFKDVLIICLSYAYDNVLLEHDDQWILLWIVVSLSNDTGIICYFRPSTLHDFRLYMIALKTEKFGFIYYTFGNEYSFDIQI